MRLRLTLLLIAVLLPVRSEALVATLPDGRTVAPAGFGIPVESVASQVALSPDGKWLAVLVDGAAVDVYSTDSSTLSSRLAVPNATRMLWTATGLYVAQGYTGAIARFTYNAKASTDNISLTRIGDWRIGPGLISGMLETPESQFCVARTANREVACIEEQTARVVRRLRTPGEPFALALAGGTMFATLFNSTVVAAWPRGATNATLIATGQHPTEILAANDRVYIANADGHDVDAIDAASLQIARRIELAPNPNEPPGRTPSGMALSGGNQLVVAESGMNDVAVVDLASGRVAERIPTAWYPMSVAAATPSTFASWQLKNQGAPQTDLWIVSAKGYGSQPNPGGEWDGTYTALVQHVLVGSKIAAVPAVSARPSPAASNLPPIKHIVFIVKENKHFDEELSDLPHVNGDMHLLLYGRQYTPNLHALALRYAVFDNFMSNGEASIYGHSWTTKGWTNDYQERNARVYPEDPVDAEEPFSIWPEPLQYKGVTDADLDFDWYQDLAALPKQPRVNTSGVFGPRGELIDELQRKHVSFRVYGEQMTMLPDGSIAPGLAAHADREYPGEHIDFKVSDTRRAQLFLADVTQHGLAAYSYLTLPTDHTVGFEPGYLTPQGYIADNDAALGEIIAGLSRRPEWKNTIIFVTTDDPQGTGDHVDSHRMPAIMIGPYASRGFVDHTAYDQASVLRTVEVLYHLDPLSTYDAAATPILDAFARQPDTSSYAALPPQIPIAVIPGVPRALSFDLDGPQWKNLPNEEWAAVYGSRSLATHVAYLRSLGIPGMTMADTETNSLRCALLALPFSDTASASL
jgi:hypothetical protein